MNKEVRKNQRILVIDDDPSLIKLMGSLLREAGYNVTLANEAPLGLELAMKDKPDLILLDVMMPIINGYNVCRLLKSQEEYKSIPIIFLTSRSDDDDRRIGQEVGANAYLSKPFRAKEILDTVSGLLPHL